MSQQSSPTFRLPKELRLLIYDQVASSILTPGSSSVSLQEYLGLIISSKQTYQEFERQYLRNFQRVLQEVRNAWRLEPPIKVPLPRNLGEASSVLIYFPEFELNVKCTDSSELHDFFAVLVDRFPSCTLVPDHEKFESLDARTACLEKLQNAIWRCTTLIRHVSLGDRRGWTPECLCVVSSKSVQDCKRRTCQLFMRLEMRRDA